MKMKKSTMVLAASLFALAPMVKAQDTMKTLFKTPQIHSVGLYVAPEMQFSQIAGAFTPTAGISLMASFNQSFSIGATMAHTVDRQFSPAGAQSLLVQSNFGGLKMEYTLKPNNTFHLSFPLTIGGGRISLDSNRANAPRPADTMRMRPPSAVGVQNYFVIQPGVQLDINLMKYAKFYVGAQYRYAATRSGAGTMMGLDLPVPSNVNLKNGLSSVGIYAGLKVGLFNYSCHKKKG